MAAGPCVRSSPGILVFFGLVWAFVAALPVFSVGYAVAATVASYVTDADTGLADTAFFAVVSVALFAAVVAVFAWPAWRHLRRSARPAPDGSGLVLRTFRRTRTVPWDDVLAVDAAGSAFVAGEEGGSFAHTIVVCRNPSGPVPRVVAVSTTFYGSPERAETVRSWFPADHPVRADRSLPGRRPNAGKRGSRR